MLRLVSQSESHRQIKRSGRLMLGLALGILVLSVAFAVSYAADPPPNHPPVIEQFMISEGPADTYEFFGYVSDPDGSTAGYVVTFGGAVASYNISATVGADGSFDEVFILRGVETGTVTADTKDPQGASAETAEYYLFVTQ
jgi:hypothetical protein